MYIYIKNIIRMKILLYNKMCTDSLISLLVQKCLCVSILRGKPSIFV